MELKLIFRKSRLNRSLYLLLIVFLLSCSTVLAQAIQSKTASPAEDQLVVKAVGSTGEPQNVYLPIIERAPGKFFGIYLKQYWNSENVNTYMPIADQAAGKKHSSVGWFIDLEDDAFTIPVTDLPKNNLYRQLEELWKAGYVSFINLGTNATAGQIINGDRDQYISYAAEFYKAWLDLGNDRIAMIAPLQEMNGTWTEYGKASSSNEIIQAYRYIINVFYQKGVRRDQVWWVFAPNGWNPPESPERMFENYYPGDDVVDFVGFSSYNYGFCPATAGISGKWESYPEIFEPYINRMKAMAPSKPVIIAETATTSYYKNGVPDEAMKNQWLIKNYNDLASNPAVVGIYYFNFTEFDGYACDFGVVQEDNFSSGYRDGVANSRYDYLTARGIGYYVR